MFGEKRMQQKRMVGVVILAAGESARMGEPKQLLSYHGKTLLRHAIETAQALPDAPILVVLGAHFAQVRPELDGLRVLVAENVDWQEGMGTSLRVGLNALRTLYPETGAALFLLCDQPHITTALLEGLVTAWRDGAPIAACAYAGKLGVPALFDASLFPELLALHGDEGARTLLKRYAAQVAAFPFPEGLVDVDTPADYSALP